MGLAGIYYLLSSRVCNLPRCEVRGCGGRSAEMRALPPARYHLCNSWPSEFPERWKSVSCRLPSGRRRRPKGLADRSSGLRGSSNPGTLETKRDATDPGVAGEGSYRGWVCLRSASVQVWPLRCLPAIRTTAEHRSRMFPCLPRVSKPYPTAASARYGMDEGKLSATKGTMTI